MTKDNAHNSRGMFTLSPTTLDLSFFSQKISSRLLVDKVLAVTVLFAQQKAAPLRLAAVKSNYPVQLFPQPPGGANVTWKENFQVPKPGCVRL